MKKAYKSPATEEIHLISDIFLSTSIPVNNDDAISNSYDIGFTKEDNGDWEDIWD